MKGNKLNKKSSGYFMKFVTQVYSLINDGKYTLALQMIEEYVKETNNEVNAASIYIDLGSYIPDEKLICKGIEIYKKAIKNNKKLQKIHKQAYNFNIGNGYNCLWDIERQQLGKEYRAFVNNEKLLIAKDYYQTSINFGNNDPRLFTNYANLLDFQGRSLEAITYYDKAIRVDNEFGMAIGNKAVSVIKLAQISGKYQTAQYFYAYTLLNKAIEFEKSIISVGGPLALNSFIEKKNEIEKLFRKRNLALDVKLPHEKFDITLLSEQLQYFYKLTINNDLFLNLHLQDKDCEAAFVDYVFISLITPIEDNSTFYKYASWINEMKESYMASRYLFILSQQKTKDLNYISKLTSIVNPLDYSTKTIYTGILKASIKESFSILDKIAHFLDEYMKLDIPKKNKISWCNIWFTDLIIPRNEKWFEKEDNMHSKIRENDNYTLFSLFSLFIDIWKSDLPDLRNLLTHSKIDVFLEGKPTRKDAYSLDELSDRAIQLLQYIKYAIIYLINFVNSQENRKKGDGGLIAPMYAITDQIL